VKVQWQKYKLEDEMHNILPKEFKKNSDMLTLAAAAKSFFSRSVANQVLFGREYISSLWAIIFSALYIQICNGKGTNVFRILKYSSVK
jgi:hypothetical protein